MDHLPQYIRAARLILKEKFMKLTFPEQKELEAWRMLGSRKPQDFEIFNYSDVFNNTNSRIQAEKQWDNFCKRLKRSRQLRTFRMVGVAATLCLLFGLSGVLYYSSERLPLEKVRESDPQGIRLILSTGETLDLSSGDTENYQKIKAVVGQEKLEYSPQVVEKTEPEWNTLVIPPAAFYHLVLSDGTRVWLNAETEITYPVQFSGERREVLLAGEAFFEVEHDPEHPFIVKTDNFEVKVLGTSFNINTYGDQGKAYAALQKGVIEMSESPGNTLVLAPGQVAELDIRRPGSLLTLSPMPIEQQLAWKDGLFCFRHTSLEEIFKQVERSYNVRFVFTGEVGEEYYTGDISRNVPLSSLLSVIRAQTTDIEFETVDQTVYVIKKRD